MSFSSDVKQIAPTLNNNTQAFDVKVPILSTWRSAHWCPVSFAALHPYTLMRNRKYICSVSGLSLHRKSLIRKAVINLNGDKVSVCNQFCV